MRRDAWNGEEKKKTPPTAPKFPNPVNGNVKCAEAQRRKRKKTETMSRTPGMGVKRGGGLLQRGGNLCEWRNGRRERERGGKEGKWREKGGGERKGKRCGGRRREGTNGRSGRSESR